MMMEITLFFGLFFISLVLSYIYFSKEVVYFGVFAAIIILLLGIYLAATGDMETTFCFSNKMNQTITGNETDFNYSTYCHTETLTMSREFINALGMIMMFIGGGMMVDFAYNINQRRKAGGGIR